MEFKGSVENEAADLKVYSLKHNNDDNQNDVSWAKFEQSGTITDYLSYCACTKE